MKQTMEEPEYDTLEEKDYKKKVTPYGNGAKIDAQKKDIGRRAYIIILKD